MAPEFMYRSAELSDGGGYRAVSRPYAKRFGYKYRRHAFDKLRALDLVLAEFQQLLGHGEVIAEVEGRLVRAARGRAARRVAAAAACGDRR